MTAEQLADLLREGHPDVEPSEVDPLVLDVWLERLGVDPGEDELIARAMVAWERLMG